MLRLFKALHCLIQQDIELLCQRKQEIIVLRHDQAVHIVADIEQNNLPILTVIFYDFPWFEIVVRIDGQKRRLDAGDQQMINLFVRAKRTIEGFHV